MEGVSKGGDGKTVEERKGGREREGEREGTKKGERMRQMEREGRRREG